MEFLIVVFYIVIFLGISMAKAASSSSVQEKRKSYNYGKTIRTEDIRSKANEWGRKVNDYGHKVKNMVEEQVFEEGRMTRTAQGGEYDQSSLDYCDSHVSASGGISFHDLAPGKDELDYLRRYNQLREKELEKSLKRDPESFGQ